MGATAPSCLYRCCRFRRRYQANRCQSLVSGVMNWAVSEDLLDVSPTHGITKRGAETVRQRVLSDAELKTFWGALRPTRIDDAIRLLLLLGQRREEVCYADKSELSVDTWSIPGRLTGRTKNKLPHIVPLTPYARKLFHDGFHFYPTTLSPRSRHCSGARHQRLSLARPSALRGYRYG